MSLLALLGFDGAAGAGEGDSAQGAVSRIAGALERFPPERARYLAGFAYLLGRVARADQHVSSEEAREMRRLVAEHGLTDDEAELVVEMADSQNELFGHSEDFVVARELQGLATRDQKLQILDCLFAVSAADDGISTVEDNEIRRISSELRLTHGDFIGVRAQWRDQLSVLRQPDGAPGT
jgi:uncharacterized tellurite resistance protein B-like protein